MESNGAHYYTIGEFARLTGLTEKALRLYADRTLLSPARVDPASGYRQYSPQQIDEGRLIAMMRAIEMPLVDIRRVLRSPQSEQPALIGRYWYAVEREIDGHRRTVRALRDAFEAKEHGVTNTETVVEQGDQGGAFAAIASLAEISDPMDAAHAFGESMKTAYWTQRDLGLVTAIAYAGASRLLAEAQNSGKDAGYELRCSAKALMYDLASFTWAGWNEPGVQIRESDAAAGLAAARSNLVMAVDLDRGDLAISRAHWMLGAQQLTSGALADAAAEFQSARQRGEIAGSEAEVELAAAFLALTRLGQGVSGARQELESSLKHLAEVENGDMFVSQVETARSVIGL